MGTALKERLPSQVLVAVIEHRLLQSAVLDPRRGIEVDRPHAHARDADGRAWNVQGFRGGEPANGSLCDEFRRVVDGVRDSFDLE